MIRSTEMSSSRSTYPALPIFAKYLISYYFLLLNQVTLKKDQRKETGGRYSPDEFSEAEGVLLDAAGDGILGIPGGIESLEVGKLI